MDILKGLYKEIKDIKKEIRKQKNLLKEKENEYNIKYAYQDWKKKEGLYFQVSEDKGNIFFCHVIEVTKEKRIYEFIDPIENYYAQDEITDPKQDCAHQKWVEITEEEYLKEKEGKTKEELA